jgi:hypothetical protein
LKYQVKFRQDAGNADRDAVIDGIRRQHGRVDPLFPGEGDSELASIFIADVPNGSDEAVLSLLGSSSAVEFFEPELRRKLVQPSGA